MRRDIKDIEERAYSLLSKLDENGNTDKSELIQLLNDWNTIKKYKDAVDNTQHSILLQSILNEIHGVNQSPIIGTPIPIQTTQEWHNNSVVDNKKSEIKVGKVVLTVLSSFLFMLAAIVFVSTFWFLLSDYAKTFIVIASGFIMLGSGIALHKRTKIYASLSLISGGIAVQYIGIVMAYAGYQIIGLAITLILLAISTCIGLWVYTKYKYTVSVIITQIGVIISSIIIVYESIHTSDSVMVHGILLILLSTISFVLTNYMSKILEQNQLFKYRLITYTTSIVCILMWVNTLTSKIHYVNDGAHIMLGDANIVTLLIIAILWVLGTYSNRIFAFMGKQVRILADVIISGIVSIFTFVIYDIYLNHNSGEIYSFLIILIASIGMVLRLYISNKQGFRVYTNSAIIYSVLIIKLANIVPTFSLGMLVVSIINICIALYFNFNTNGAKTSTSYEKVISTLLIPITTLVSLNIWGDTSDTGNIVCMISVILSIITVLYIQYIKETGTLSKNLIQFISDLIFLFILIGTAFDINELFGIVVPCYMLAVRFMLYNKADNTYKLISTIYNIIAIHVIIFGLLDYIILDILISSLLLALAYSTMINKGVNSVTKILYSMCTHTGLMVIAYECSLYNVYQFGIIMLLASIVSMLIGFKTDCSLLRVVSLILLIISVLVITFSITVVAGSLGVIVSLILSGILILVISIAYSKLEKSMHN